MAWPHDRKTLWRRRNVERPKRIWQPGYGRNQGLPTGSTAGYDRLMPCGANVDFGRPFPARPRRPRSPTEYKKRLCGNFEREEGRVLRFNDRPVTGDREASPSEQYVEGAFEEYKDRRLQLPSNLYPYIMQRMDCPSSVDSEQVFGNLMDWSSTNLLGITMLMKMYLWNGNITDNEVLQGVGRYELLFDNNNLSGDPTKNCMISFAWNPEGKYGAIGMISGEILIWDSEVRRKVRTLKINNDPNIWEYATSLAWSTNNILTCGTVSGKIMSFDIAQALSISQFRVPHRLIIHGLKWSSCHQYLASADSNGMMCIWDILNTGSSNSNPNCLHRLNAHEGPVKALEWKSKILVSAGINDKCIKIWNVALGQEERSRRTHSGIWSLLWSKSRDDLFMSAHGSRQNCVTLWKYPDMHIITQMRGHFGPVTHISQNPNGTKIASLCESNEEFFMWDISSTLTFDPNPPRREDEDDDPSKVLSCS